MANVSPTGCYPVILIYTDTQAFPSQMHIISPSLSCRVNICICVCTGVWRPEVDIRYLPQLPFNSVFWNRLSHWTWSLLVRLAWPVNEPPGSSCPHLPSAGVISMCHHSAYMASPSATKTSSEVQGSRFLSTSVDVLQTVQAHESELGFTLHC